MTPRLHVAEDAADLARYTADWLVARLRLGASRIALSGGSTPKALFAMLATPAYAGAIDWSRIELFWGDERFVPPDHPESNYGMTRDALLAHVPIPEANVHPMPTDGTPEEAAGRYERLLQHVYGAETLGASRPLFDIQFLGLGEDGHTASLIPGQPVLLERTRWVAPVAQGRPEVRLTLTYPALDSSAAVVFLVNGAGKRDIVRRFLAGEPSLPATNVAPVGELHLFCDRAAAPE